MKRIIGNILIIIYTLIAVFTTVCLLSFNEYKISTFGDCSLVLVTNDELLPNYKKGDLVIVDKKSKIITGRKAFFYTTSDRKIEIKLGTVEAIKNVSNSETTYTLEGGRDISGEYLLGPVDTVEIIPVVGGILNVLESKWGFLFLIVLPSLLAFVYQISVVIAEIKNNDE